jgi:hypothetical protein
LPLPFLNRNSRREFRLPHKNKLRRTKRNGGPRRLFDASTTKTACRVELARARSLKTKSIVWLAGVVGPRLRCTTAPPRGRTRCANEGHVALLVPSSTVGCCRAPGDADEGRRRARTIGRWCRSGAVGKVDTNRACTRYHAWYAVAVRRVRNAFTLSSSCSDTTSPTWSFGYLVVVVPRDDPRHQGMWGGLEKRVAVEKESAYTAARPSRTQNPCSRYLAARGQRRCTCLLAYMSRNRF